MADGVNDPASGDRFNRNRVIGGSHRHDIFTPAVFKIVTPNCLSASAMHFTFTASLSALDRIANTISDAKRRLLHQLAWGLSCRHLSSPFDNLRGVLKQPTAESHREGEQNR